MEKNNFTLEKARRLLSLDPTLTYRFLAKEIGVSHQRIAQLVEAYDLPKVGRWRDTSRMCLGGCGKRLNKKVNRSGWCRECSRIAHGFEYTCANCREVKVDYGNRAHSRRTNIRAKKYPSLNFCSNRCSGTYFSRRNKKEA